jgi:uncharacterized OB-fold protein
VLRQTISSRWKELQAMIETRRKQLFVAHRLLPSQTARLNASRHRKTGHVFFPQIPEHLAVADEYETITLSAEARLYSFTIIHPSPKAGQPPFALAYADFPEGVRVMGRLVAEAPPVIGAALSVEVDETAEGAAPSYRFVPAP